MTSINKFDLNVYSEELHQVSEADYDEVMAASAVEGGWQGYTDWSTELEGGELENLHIEGGRVYHRSEPESLGRINGVEL